MSDVFDRMTMVSGADAIALKGILRRNLPSACMTCGGPMGTAGQLSAVCTGMCPRCSGQMKATTTVTIAAANGSEARLEGALDRFAEGMGIDPVLSREDSEGP